MAWTDVSTRDRPILAAAPRALISCCRRFGGAALLPGSGSAALSEERDVARDGTCAADMVDCDCAEEPHDSRGEKVPLDRQMERCASAGERHERRKSL